MKHVDSEIIHAFADGKDIQWKSKANKESDWQDLDKECALFETNLRQYRLKPAAPKWPQTTMTSGDLSVAYQKAISNDALIDVANAAIAHACEIGQVVPAIKVREVGRAIRSACHDGGIGDSELNEIFINYAIK